MKYYLNNAGSGLMSSNTFNLITDHIRLERNVGAYKAAQLSKNQIEQFYIRIAKLINASAPSEIAFMDSASRAWNMALNSMNLQENAHIVTLSTEFGTNLITLYRLAQQFNAKIQVIKCDREGGFSISEIEEALNKGASIIALSHVAAHGSIINPVEEIGVLAKKYDAIYIVDGCQAVGQIKADVQSMKCDVYTGTGRKWLRGPRGTGFLYVKSSSPFNSSQLDLASADLDIDKNLNVLGVKVRNDARQFELWERNIACMLGLSSAIGEYLNQDQNITSEKIRILSNRLRTAVLKNQNLNLLGKKDSESGVVGFFLNDPAREIIVKEKFEKANIGLSAMSDWDCPLHFPKNGASVIFRLSPHYYTEESTIDTVCSVISEL